MGDQGGILEGARGSEWYRAEGFSMRKMGGRSGRGIPSSVRFRRSTLRRCEVERLAGWRGILSDLSSNLESGVESALFSGYCSIYILWRPKIILYAGSAAMAKEDEIKIVIAGGCYGDWFVSTSTSM